MSARWIWRWVPSAVLVAVTGWVVWTNHSSPDTRIVFSFLHPLVGRDPEALSGATIAVLMTMTVVLVLGAVRETRTAIRDDPRDGGDRDG